MDIARGFHDHVHLYANVGCNLNCQYCFKEIFEEGNNGELLDIANILADNSVKHVTIGGGEPTLKRSLPGAFRILKNGDVYTELHTNGTLLTPRYLKQLEGSVDKIAIPIDSMNPTIQKKLKGIDYIPIFKKAVKDIHEHDFKLVYHTVATQVNYSSIPDIYPFIKKGDFSRWDIYLYDWDLARRTWFESSFDKDNEAFMTLRNELAGGLSEKDGGISHILGNFLLLEEKMKEVYNDKRIKFGNIIDSKTPYIFVAGNGDVMVSKNRIRVGNLLKDGFEKIERKLDNDDTFDNVMDKYQDSCADLPLFARMAETEVGAIPTHHRWEEETISEKHWPLVNHLMDIYIKKYPTGIC